MQCKVCDEVYDSGLPNTVYDICEESWSGIKSILKENRLVKSLKDDLLFLPPFQYNTNPDSLEASPSFHTAPKPQQIWAARLKPYLMKFLQSI